jgi:hypothetical protein
MTVRPGNKAKYEALVIAVATGQSVVDWCRATRTPRSTAIAWQADVRFERDVARIQRQMVQAAVGKFVGAVETIASGMIELV